MGSATAGRPVETPEPAMTVDGDRNDYAVFLMK
jgi:hypothetical protein